MALSRIPLFKKKTWVRVVHSEHPFFDKIGQVKIAGHSACEVEFSIPHENGGSQFISKALLNRYLIAAERPLFLEKGASILVVGLSSPYYQRRGIVEYLIAGNEIALVDFGNRFRDEAGTLHKVLKQIHRDDIQLLEASAPSSGGDKGGPRFRNPQG